MENKYSKLEKEELIALIEEMESNDEFHKKTCSKLDEIKSLIDAECNDLNTHLVDSQREMIDALNKKLFKMIEEKRNLSRELYELKKKYK